MRCWQKVQGFEPWTLVFYVSLFPTSRFWLVRQGTCNLYISIFTTQKSFFFSFKKREWVWKKGWKENFTRYFRGGIWTMWGHLSQLCRSAFIPINHTFIRQHNHGLLCFSWCFHTPTNTGRLCVVANIQDEWWMTQYDV